MKVLITCPDCHRKLEVELFNGRYGSIHCDCGTILLVDRIEPIQRIVKQGEK